MTEITCADRFHAFARMIIHWLAAAAVVWGYANNVSAQERSIVRVTVRSASGDSLPNARLRAIGGSKDTVARGNERGLAALLLPRGAYRIAVSVLGYQSRQSDIAITSDTAITITLERSTQQLANVDVVAKWIGIRGIVGDSTSMQALAGATVHETSGERRKVVTDSLGRFEIPLERAAPMVLRIESPGYLSRTAYVSLSPDAHAPEVVVFLNAGKDRNSVFTAMFDYSKRAPWMGTRSFMLSRDELVGTGQKNVESALLSTDALTKRGLVMAETLCVFVNGVPMPMRALSFYRPQDVEFVELWAEGSEQPNTLARSWPRGALCGQTSKLRTNASSRTILKWAVVWLKP